MQVYTAADVTADKTKQPSKFPQGELGVNMQENSPFLT